MSKSRRQWSGGKGDDSRVEDYKAYRNGYDNISFEGFRKDRHKDVIEPFITVSLVKEPKPVDTKKYLFLDDIRIPNDAYLWGENKRLKDASNVPCNRWDIVRTYDEFVEWINKNGIPHVVSFDNDLFDEFDESVSPEQYTEWMEMEGWENFSIKTGAHCAQYLVNECRIRKEPIPTYYIHTANNKARPIIEKILKDENV